MLATGHVVLPLAGAEWDQGPTEKGVPRNSILSQVLRSKLPVSNRFLKPCFDVSWVQPRPWLALLIAAWAGPLFAQESNALRESGPWENGFTLAPYGWLAGVDGTLGARSGEEELPPRLDAVVDGDLEQIGFMFYGEWRGDRWLALFDSVWANVDQPGEIRLGQVPVSGATAEVDGNIYQVGLGYRVTSSSRSFLALYGGARYYDVEVALDVQADILPRPLHTAASQAWTDAVAGLRWSRSLGEHWQAFALVDVGTGQSDLSWQVFATVGYRFSWGSLQAGYRYLSLDYDGDDYLADISLGGPLAGIAFRF